MDLLYLNLTTYLVKVTVMISKMLLLRDSYNYRATVPQGKRELKLTQAEVLKPRRLRAVQ